MDKFIYPQYSGKSLLNVPSTVLKLFGADPLKETLPEKYFQNAVGAEKQVLFLFDGFGHNLYKKEGIKYPFFKNLQDKGFYAPITSVFPSTTAAAINTINSGLSPIEHGLPEWYVYFQELDTIMQTLPFIPLIPSDLEKVKDVLPEILFNQKTIYQHLGDINIPTYVVIGKSLVKSFYNQKSSQGATLVPYTTLAEMVVTLRTLLTQISGKAYIYVYYSSIDSAEHVYGVWTDQVKAEVSNLAYMLQTEIVEKIDSEAAQKIGIMLTADHGQISVDPAKTIYLDEIGGFKKFLKNGPTSVLAPTGGGRDVFLNIKENKLEDCLEFLKTRLKGKAEVFTLQEMFDKKIFGEGEVHTEFISRVGNVFILPLENYTVWYHHDKNMEYTFLGAHGGLSEDEMLIPFACAKLFQLQE